MTGVDEGVFVVGTDTGVGKTVVTAGLTGWLRERGVDAVAVKPCQSGYPPDDDAGFVAAVCGTDDASVCLQYLEPALAPEVAASVADESVAYDEILSGVRTQIENDDPTVVEGIGGLRVPLADGKEVLDLVEDVGLPALVVARSGLGTLNHTALTVEALRRREIPVAGVILNRYEGASLSERTNPDVLEGMIDCPVWTMAPLDLTEPGRAIEAVRETVPAAVLDS